MPLFIDLVASTHKQGECSHDDCDWSSSHVLSYGAVSGAVTVLLFTALICITAVLIESPAGPPPDNTVFESIELVAVIVGFGLLSRSRSSLRYGYRGIRIRTAHSQGLILCQRFLFVSPGASIAERPEHIVPTTITGRPTTASGRR